jgi:hypothetical protein
MSSPTPLLVVPALLWTVVAGASVIASVVISVRAKRRGTSPTAWNPFAPPFPAALAVAAFGYFAAALAAGQLSFGAAAFASLWPAMAASALHHAASGRAYTWPDWGTYAFAGLGALLYGALPL